MVVCVLIRGDKKTRFSFFKTRRFFSVFLFVSSPPSILSSQQQSELQQSKSRLHGLLWRATRGEERTQKQFPCVWVPAAQQIATSIKRAKRVKQGGKIMTPRAYVSSTVVLVPKYTSYGGASGTWLCFLLSLFRQMDVYFLFGMNRANTESCMHYGTVPYS